MKKPSNLRGIRVEERGTANFIEMASTDDQTPLTPQTKIDETKKGRKRDHSININQMYLKMFEDLGNSSIKSRTMFKVNAWLRESNPSAYTPKMVSIGPYHKKDVQLHPMEKYKLLYLRRFLGRKQELKVESCIKELEGLKEKALKCYDDVETDKFCHMKCYGDAKTDKFCQMLLHDGCFVVEFLRECYEMYPQEVIINENIVGVIGQDLLLLENQLPFFVIDKLHDMTKQDDKPLGILASNYVKDFVTFPETTIGISLEITEDNIKKITGGNIKHLLHLKHAISCYGNRMKKPEDDVSRPIEEGGCYNIKNKLRHAGNGFCNALSKLRPMVTSNTTEVSESRKEAGNGKDNDDQTWHMIMPNATELSEAGVSFERATVEISLFDSIKFENGSMIIPRFRVDDNTETILRNLIAYEQQSVDIKRKHFSDFAIFMDKLIESDKEVNLFCHEGIIENWLGDDKEVANLFNKIGNGLLVPEHDFIYKEKCREAVKYSKRRCNKMRASLLRNYFSSIWVGTSTVAAFLLLVLTLTQTILAIIDLVNK